MNRCNICLEETCNGLHNCQCEKCSKVNECYRYLHATIRITKRMFNPNILIISIIFRGLTINCCNNGMRNKNENL